jgi:hypothetical protein
MREREKALEAAAKALIDFHNAPVEVKRPDIHQRLVQRLANAIAMPATVDVACSVILSDIEDALPRWIEAMGDWDRGGEQSIDEMGATLEDIRNLTPPEDAP